MSQSTVTHKTVNYKTAIHKTAIYDTNTLIHANNASIQIQGERTTPTSLSKNTDTFYLNSNQKTVEPLKQGTFDPFILLCVSLGTQPASLLPQQDSIIRFDL